MCDPDFSDGALGCNLVVLKRADLRGDQNELRVRQYLEFSVEPEQVPCLHKKRAELVVAPLLKVDRVFDSVSLIWSKLNDAKPFSLESDFRGRLFHGSPGKGLLKDQPWDSQTAFVGEVNDECFALSDLGFVDDEMAMDGDGSHPLVCQEMAQYQDSEKNIHRVDQET
jgi:hypothetical protein